MKLSIDKKLQVQISKIDASIAIELIKMFCLMCNQVWYTLIFSFFYNNNINKSYSYHICMYEKKSTVVVVFCTCFSMLYTSMNHCMGVHLVEWMILLIRVNFLFISKWKKNETKIITKVQELQDNLILTGITETFKWELLSRSDLFSINENESSRSTIEFKHRVEYNLKIFI